MCSGLSLSREVSEQGAYLGRSWLLTGAMLGGESGPCSEAP